MSAQSEGPRQTPEPDHEIAGQACRECRRRKSKCDRVLPVCHLCGRFKRRCMYEKQTRTPLTRTHLSRVEAELAQTKALLRRFMPEESLNNIDRDESVDPENETTDRDPHYIFNSQPQPVDVSAAPPPVGQPPDHHTLMTSTVAGQEANYGPSLDGQAGPLSAGASALAEAAQTGQSPHRAVRGTSASRSVGTSALSLETPPTSSNFEWDERIDAGGGSRFIDGMASLTSNLNEGGYLGKLWTLNAGRKTLLHAHACIQDLHQVLLYCGLQIPDQPIRSTAVAQTGRRAIIATPVFHSRYRQCLSWNHLSMPTSAFITAHIPLCMRQPFVRSSWK